MNEATAGAVSTDPYRPAQNIVDESDLTWRVLATLNVFRFFVAIALLVLYFATDNPRFFGDRYPGVFAATAAGYLMLSVAVALAIRVRGLSATGMVYSLVAVDIVAIIALMHASGGISSGLGGLLVVFVGATSLIMPMRVPSFFAALAALAILSEQFFSQLGGASSSGNYPAAGVLGAIIFAISMTARPLASRIQASEALARQRGVDLANLSELNEYIVQHLRESIVVVDDDDQVRLINASAAKLLGAPEQTASRPIGEFAGNLGAFLKLWRSHPGKSGHQELEASEESGGARIIAHVAPLGKDDERRGPALIFLEDAGVMNARVQQSKLASLGRLSASIAHEIRNPVGAMSHAGQLLAESESLGDDDLRLTEIIRGNAERVSHIIDNVLQLSRRESSRPKLLQLEPWLREFTDEFVRTLELHEGELSILDVPPGLAVRMDPSHLRQVLWNLCDNAVKYASETGGILVELRAGVAGQNDRPFLEVLDQGHGVDPDNLDKIFEPFYTDKHGGTGLGLYISKELCELNRASISAQPRPGGGSAFRIVFSDPRRKWGDDGDDDDTSTTDS